MSACGCCAAIGGKPGPKAEHESAAGRMAAWLRRRWLPLVTLAVVAATGAGLLVASPWQRSGAVHDLTASRIWGIVQALAASGLVVLADKGYLGEDHIRTPYRGRNKPHPSGMASSHHFTNASPRDSRCGYSTSR